VTNISYHLQLECSLMEAYFLHTITYATI